MTSLQGKVKELNDKNAKLEYNSSLRSFLSEQLSVEEKIKIREIIKG